MPMVTTASTEACRRILVMLADEMNRSDMNAENRQRASRTSAGICPVKSFVQEVDVGMPGACPSVLLLIIQFLTSYVICVHRIRRRRCPGTFAPRIAPVSLQQLRR